jgi:PhnB protein
MNSSVDGSRIRGMTVRLNPYISFSDNAREALEFYRDVFGGELEISTFEGMPPEMLSDPNDATKVMHGQLTTPDGFTLMCADTPAGMPRNVGDDISVSLSGDDLAKLTGWWEKLSASGSVTVPFVQAPWGDTFGMCIDGFGVHWMVNAASN